MSDSVWPHRRQPTRLLHPWDSPGNNTGVGCHFLLQCMKVKVKSLSPVRLLATDPMDCSLTGSSIHVIFQARVLEWNAIAFINSYDSWETHKDNPNRKKKKNLIAAVLMSAWSVKHSRFLSACGEMQRIFEWEISHWRLFMLIMLWDPLNCLRIMSPKHLVLSTPWKK